MRLCQEALQDERPASPEALQDERPASQRPCRPQGDPAELLHNRSPQLWGKATLLSGQDPEPTTCARNARGQGRPACPSIPAQAACCCSNGGINHEWGKLFLPLSRLQKETKSPFTSANNALMWAPAPCSPHKPGSVQATNRHPGLWGHSQQALSRWATHASPQARLGKVERSTTLRPGPAHAPSRRHSQRCRPAWGGSCHSSSQARGRGRVVNNSQT